MNDSIDSWTFLFLALVRLLFPYLIVFACLLIIILDQRTRQKLREKERKEREEALAQLSASAGERFAPSQKVAEDANAASDNRIREPQSPIQEKAP
jgi:hypothetical protein